MRSLTIGVQMVGDDLSNTPPAHALTRRGVIDNVRGYMLYGDYAKDSPPPSIIDDVADKRLDVAVVWGPPGRLLRRPAQARAADPSGQPAN